MNTLPTLDPRTLKALVHNALRSWHIVGGTPETLLGSLLLVRDRLREIGEPRPEALRLATNQVLLEGMEELARQDVEGARILKERFLNENITLQVAHQLNLSPDQVNHRQGDAIKSLTQILFSREQAARLERASSLEAQLPPPSYSRLFGFDTAIQTLTEKLLDPEAARILNLVGIGGAGKTSLADAVTRRVIETNTFERVIWLRSETQTWSGASPSPQSAFGALVAQLAASLSPDGYIAADPEKQVRQALKTAPHLVVMDNLETEAEALHILERLHGLANPSKFLITSRGHPPKEAEVFTFQVTALSATDAADLIRHHAGLLGVTDLATGNQEDIDAIYAMTGGHPLAIKLVVGLTRQLPLALILEDFRQMRLEQVEDMYRRIYRQAWQTLSAEAKTLMQAMSLTPESGALPDQMQGVSGLSTDLFWKAITELASRSLLEVLGSSKERRYGIHGLTRSFLVMEIVRWSLDEP